MKKVVSITEADLKRIVKKVLKEQDGEVSEQLRKTGTKTIPILKSKTKEKKLLNKTNIQPRTPEDQWESYVNGPNAQTMVSLMTPSSVKTWEKIKQEQLPLAVASIESFNDTYTESKWNKVYCTKAGTEKQVIPQEPKVYPSVPMTFPANAAPSADFFVDNYYATTQYFKDQFKADVVDPVAQQSAAIATPADGKPKMYLKSLSVATSCSRIPNTKSPDGKTYTFEQLAKLRNDEALKYIKEQLSALGVFIDGNSAITQNSAGQNGDGTSGPEWKQGVDRKQYEQYKYLVVNIDIILNVQPAPSEEQGEDIITTQLYRVVFKRETGVNFNIKIPLFSWTQKGRRKPKKGIGKDRCPAFD
jgi:hypothetical protein